MDPVLVLLPSPLLPSLVWHPVAQLVDPDQVAAAIQALLAQFPASTR